MAIAIPKPINAHWRTDMLIRAYEPCLGATRRSTRDEAQRGGRKDHDSGVIRSSNLTYAPEWTPAQGPDPGDRGPGGGTNGSGCAASAIAPNERAAGSGRR